MEEETNRTHENGAEIHYFCKVCGVDVFSGMKTRCSYCNAPICEKCDSHGFCLNCFLNLATDAQTSLKLSKTLAWAVPLLLAFIVWNNFWVWVAGVGGTALFFIFIHFYFRLKIVKHPERYFYPRWQKIVNSEEYKRFIDENNKMRVVSFFQVEKRNTLEQDKIEEMRIENERNKKYAELGENENGADEKDEDLPDIPAYMDEKYHLSDEMKEILSSEAMNEQDFDETNSILESSQSSNISAKGAEALKNNEGSKIFSKCTLCKRELAKGNICFECKVRICPKCGEDNRFTTARCICGYRFEPLENYLNE